jgi:hypothetical protein
MAFDPDKPSDIRKLQIAREESMRELDLFRQKEAVYYRQYVGHHYPADPAGEVVAYNLIDLVVTTYQTVLAANNPRVLVSSNANALKARAKNVEIAINHILKEIEFQQVLGRAVTGAFFSMGILKVGNDLNPKRSLIGFRRETGQPFVQDVLFRNWVHDTRSRRRDDCRFFGDEREEYIDYMREAGDIFDPEVVEAMAEQDEAENAFGDGVYSPIRRPYGGDVFMPRGRVCDVWIPTERVVVGLPGRIDLQVDKPLYIIDWKGPEHGPYHPITFSDVPGQAMPRPPAALWLDIHNSVNLLFNKTIEQAKRAKMIYPYFGPRGYRDMMRIMEGADGQTVRLNDPNSVMQPIKIPGADAETTQMIDKLIASFSYFGGNVNIVGGLSAQSPTLGQDQMLRQGANDRMGMMQNRVTDVVRRVERDLGHYLSNNPLINLPLSKPIGATGLSLDFRFNNDVQQGDEFDLNYDVVPFSMANMTPALKSQALLNVLREMAPYMQPMQAQGITLNFMELWSMLAGFNNVPEITDLAIVSGEQPSQAPLSELASPHITSRQNVRLDSPRNPDGRTSLSQVPGQGGGGGGNQSPQGGRPLTVAGAA